jgi:inner membrane protein
VDTLTHGLLGAAVGAVPLPRALADPSPRAARAGVIVGVVASELPDLDYLLPAGDAVLSMLQAHRGLTHSIIFVPVIALVAALIVQRFFPDARRVPLFVRALIAVPLAHLLPDLWTGWGTRLLLPFSDTRAALDWLMVIDPVFTLPLAAAAVLAFRRRAHWRRIMLAGVAVSVAYVGARVGIALRLTADVRAVYPAAASVHVFPAPLAVWRWRYVARVDGDYAAGEVALGEEPVERARVPATPTGPMPAALAAVPTVREALLWARFPVVRVATEGSTERVDIADLRYHLRGEPTLKLVIVVTAGTVTEARLDRGGSASDLWRRWRSKG